MECCRIYCFGDRRDIDWMFVFVIDTTVACAVPHSISGTRRVSSFPVWEPAMS